jgi:hypothetical protein
VTAAEEHRVRQERRQPRLLRLRVLATGTGPAAGAQAPAEIRQAASAALAEVTAPAVPGRGDGHGVYPTMWMRPLWRLLQGSPCHVRDRTRVLGRCRMMDGDGPPAARPS